MGFSSLSIFVMQAVNFLLQQKVENKKFYH